MLLLSAALIWHWQPGEGARAAAAARPRPPGVFERCSWVPGGWQTWQRRVGRAPEPTTKKGGGWPNERRGRRRRRTPERLATQRQPKRAPGAAGPGASRPCRRAGSPGAMLQPPACPGPPRGWDSRPRSLQHRGRIVPTSGKPAASTRLLPCWGRGSPHPSTPWSSWGDPVLTPKKTAGVMAGSPATGLNPRVASQVPWAKPRITSPSLSFPDHTEKRERGSCRSGLLCGRMESKGERARQQPGGSRQLWRTEGQHGVQAPRPCPCPS